MVRWIKDCLLGEEAVLCNDDVVVLTDYLPEDKMIAIVAITKK